MLHEFELNHINDYLEVTLHFIVQTRRMHMIVLINVIKTISED